MMYSLAKVFTDIVLSILAILLLLPVFILISFSVWLSSEGPIFYRGIRAGRNGNDFYILKFRTMVADAERLGGASTAVDDPRFTRIGRFLRRYKLDELPQFINVLRGEMSLVGPRPQVLYYTEQYKGDEKAILSVRPGITDLASLYFSDMDTILGSGDVDSKYAAEIEPVKNKLRLRYVKDASYILDLRILIETVFNLIGVSNITRLNIRP